MSPRPRTGLEPALRRRLLLCAILTFAASAATACGGGGGAATTAVGAVPARSAGTTDVGTPGSSTARTATPTWPRASGPSGPSSVRGASGAARRRGSAARAVTTVATRTSAETSPIRAETATGFAVSVWLPYWQMSAALSSTLGASDLVGTASPFWYALSGDGTVVADPGAGDPTVLAGLRERGVRVLPTVTETDGLAAFVRTLASPSRRAAVVRSLSALAASGPYAGLDLDFETFAVDPRGDRALADAAAAEYPALVGEVCAALHATHRTCSVTVMPRTTARPVYWRGDLATWVYDYAALASVADRVQVMAYDENAPGGPAGAVSPLPWTEQVIAYTRAVVPAGRAELGLPVYGYDWTGANAVAVGAGAARALAAAYGTAPRWDPAAGEETFTYTAGRQPHVVWYESAPAVALRVRLAAAAGFAGVDLWAAGDEDAATWPVLRSLLGR